MGGTVGLQSEQLRAAVCRYTNANTRSTPRLSARARKSCTSRAKQEKNAALEIQMPTCSRSWSAP